MVSSKLIIVFVLPVIFSIIFGSAVMADILQKPDRELNMWPISFSEGSSSHDSSLKIIGLSNQYLVTEPIEVQVKVTDSSFNCGDLYITIYYSGNNDVVTQGGFFNQCFTNGDLFPINDKGGPTRDLLKASRQDNFFTNIFNRYCTSETVS